MSEVDLKNLQEVTERFRAWASTQPVESRTGEWECDYESWSEIYQNFERFLQNISYDEWDDASFQTILYLIARDNECQRLSYILAADPQRLLHVANAALTFPDSDARWQMAAQIGKLKEVEIGRQAEDLLLHLVQDENEYVRRQALMALAKIHSPYVEKFGVKIWNTEHESQQWARMATLWSLYQVGSPLLNKLIDEAESDARPYLADYAKRIRNGELESGP